jgi:hypothetical protein
VGCLLKSSSLTAPRSWFKIERRFFLPLGGGTTDENDLCSWFWSPDSAILTGTTTKTIFEGERRKVQDVYRSPTLLPVCGS